MSRFLKPIAVVLILIAVAALVVIGYSAPRSNHPEDVVSIAASFYPVALAAERIGGTHVHVTTLVPPGTEPHDFEPTAQEIARIYDSEIFLYNGGGVDAWASKLAPSAASEGILVMGMYESIPNLLAATEHDHGEDEHDADHGEDEHEEEFDGHFWLDPGLLALQAEAIRDLLVKADPTHSADYESNARAFVADLTELDAEYEAGLADCELRVAVTSHAAFAYLARSYGFEQLPITGISPEEEPSAGGLAELADTSRRYGVKYVFFETLVSPKLAETLANEIGAQTLVFNPIEGLTDEELEASEDYFSIMRNNLSNLRTAMLCQ